MKYKISKIFFFALIMTECVTAQEIACFQLDPFGGGGILPAGDQWSTYPAYGKLFGSIRLEAQRDGIADYELLKLLEITHPEEAQSIARSTIYDFDRYDSNVELFRKKRIKILELLSGTYSGTLKNEVLTPLIPR